MDKNIAVSGWPGSGGTSVSILLAYQLNYKLLKGSQTFRYLGQTLEKSDVGLERIETDKYLEPIFGPIYDKYIDYKLVNSRKIVIDSDIAGFRLGKRAEYFSIFIVTDREVRIKRLESDNRKKDVDFLELREKESQKFYKKLYGIDWLDKNEIKAKYNLVLDNTNLGIKEEFELIYKGLVEQRYITRQEEKRLNYELEELENLFWKKGKMWFINELKKNEQIIETVDVLNEIKKLFPIKIDSLPEKIKNII